MTALYYPRRNNLVSYDSWIPHVLFWVLVFMLYFIDFQDSRHNDLFALCLAALNVTLGAAIAYAHYEWVKFTLEDKKLPHISFKKEPFKKMYADGREVKKMEWTLWKGVPYTMDITFPFYLIGAFILIFTDSFFYKYFGDSIGYWISQYHNYLKPIEGTSYYFTFPSNIPEATTIMYLFMGMRYALRHHELYIQNEFEKKHKKLEIIALRWQLEPHFLLSSLKSTYEAIEDRNAEAALKIIKKVMKMTNYVVRECSYYQRDKSGNTAIKEGEVNLVPLASEIDFIKDFIELKILEKEHKPERIDVDIKIEKQDQDYRIVPMILICYIENAFKHGLDEDPKHGKIKIDLRVNNNDELTLRVYNTRLLDKLILNNVTNYNEENHIGERDTRALLDEVYRQEGYRLKTSNRNDNEPFYEVELIIFKLKKGKK